MQAVLHVIFMFFVVKLHVMIDAIIAHKNCSQEGKGDNNPFSEAAFAWQQVVVAVTRHLRFLFLLQLPCLGAGHQRRGPRLPRGHRDGPDGRSRHVPSHLGTLKGQVHEGTTPHEITVFQGMHCNGSHRETVGLVLKAKVMIGEDVFLHEWKMEYNPCRSYQTSRFSHAEAAPGL